ncbi:Dabb family protein [Candidatus Stoquefichus massiliensis]|uniref:Dabb family protein n=1 Tax=Candidatus Stoquefichus massiliensis TaxID=1470350 RepID=UPI000486FAF6|nr:Dabb family protein [Candidatus Stoquefichus massiliensis]
MIKHIVCFKLKDNSPENCQKTKDILMSMKDHVKLLKDIQVGIDFLHSERSYDIILETILEDEESLDAYQNDPYHCNVVKKHMHAVRSASIAIDYYIDENKVN